MAGCHPMIMNHIPNARIPAPVVLLLLLMLGCQGSSLPVKSNQPPPNVATAVSVQLSDGDFDQHVNQLKKKLPSNDFSVVIQKPFVVIGDEPKRVVQQHAEDTVKWAVERLKQDYFRNDPKEILDIWLFKDAPSYEKHTRLLFGEEPTTPYGYYSSAHKALIMNIATGGGTLVHELVHPFMEANFSACPAWFNEGLGSLYEQCGDVNGHIYGFVNWRLPGLQRAIKAGSLPTFKKLTAMDANAFYGDTKGTNYAQARYLCHYLQGKRLLIKFCQEFQRHQKQDPTGYASLRKILGESDMDAFQRRWEKYALALNEEFTLRSLR